MGEPLQGYRKMLEHINEADEVERVDARRK